MWPGSSVDNAHGIIFITVSGISKKTNTTQIACRYSVDTWSSIVSMFCAYANRLMKEVSYMPTERCKDMLNKRVRGYFAVNAFIKITYFLTYKVWPPCDWSRQRLRFSGTTARVHSVVSYPATDAVDSQFSYIDHTRLISCSAAAHYRSPERSLYTRKPAAGPWAILPVSQSLLRSTARQTK